jgi:hypothetical protein
MVSGRDGLWLEAGQATIEATVFNHINGNCFISGGMIESGGDNIESADTCGFHTTGDMVNQDPYLAPLADNGGPTHTHWLQANSPAINAITFSRCQLNQDQRGAPRPKHGSCDIGAVEVNQELMLPIVLK